MRVTSASQSYATVVRGSGNDPDANPERLMDISEVVDASGDVLSTQAQPGEALPLSSGESKTQVEKEASEILQDTTSTEVVKAASQEAPIKETLSTPETEVPKQSAVSADGLTTFDNKSDPSAMDLSPSTCKDNSDAKRKKHPPDTIAMDSGSGSPLVQRIQFNKDLWELTMLPALLDFHKRTNINKENECP
ncbi:hypothetical protein HPB47_017669 [Ixodes persulcatus]|uniref:Uncharacterized protein n=1 Tax=Ixodes persulcatus TaxID=34615 RepID=A0AC60QRE7_IXOPE|nr:hypothetical protein HPB47_017669 [Ixodes persulcatus]